MTESGAPATAAHSGSPLTVHAAPAELSGSLTTSQADISPTDKVSSASSAQNFLSQNYVFTFLVSVIAGSFALSLPNVCLDLYPDDSSKAAIVNAVAASIIAFLHFFCNPVYGFLSDSFGRRFFCLLCLVGTFIAALSVSIYPSLLTVILYAVFMGIFDVGLVMANAMVGDVSTAHDFVTNFSKLGAATFLGVLLGAALGAGLSDIATRAPFILCAVVSIIDFLYVKLKMKESRNSQASGKVQQEVVKEEGKNAYLDETEPNEKTNAEEKVKSAQLTQPAASPTSHGATPLSAHEDTPLKAPANLSAASAASSSSSLSLAPATNSSSPPAFKWDDEHWKIVRHSLNPFKHVYILRRHPFLVYCACAGFLETIVASGVISTFYIYFTQRYGWGPIANGGFVLSVAVAVIICQGVLLPYIIKHQLFTEKQMMAMCLIVECGALLIVALMPISWLCYLAVLPVGIATLIQPILQGALSRHVSPQHQGQMQGAINCLQSFGLIWGPLAITGSFAYFISDNAPVYLPSAPLYVALLLTLISAVLIFIAFHYYYLPPHIGEADIHTEIQPHIQIEMHSADKAEPAKVNVNSTEKRAVTNEDEKRNEDGLVALSIDVNTEDEKDKEKSYIVATANSIASVAPTGFDTECATSPVSTENISMDATPRAP